MNGINRVTLLGNLGADPELRYTQGGTAVLNIRIATPERFNGKDGQWTERTEWHNVVIWGKRGEALANILRKGSSVLVEGTLRTTSYDAKDGGKRYKTAVNATNVILCGGRNDRPAQASTDHAHADSMPHEDEAPPSSLPF